MKSWVLISTALLLISLEQVVSSAKIQEKYQGIDPANLVTIGNETFYISPQDVEGVSVADAEKYCGGDNMKLISFQSSEKWTMISQYLENNGYSNSQTFWSSGKESDGKWYWTATGEPIVYTKWAPEEPNSNGVADCLHFYQRFGWYDTSCTNKFHFICEF